ncbi:MG2 domain-containing protein [Cyclobacterium lianum]|uniref:MG2 domain-containing protein n=1 Tax=Cyclobacterium lianum TaxID=388280 RepID=A0A1M7LJW0_9BACT|nr:TonB-dependent receptor plug domain-containing protein [Cyclobacterium lianum]SHM77857.1 MG2 domain-containing protein [Cyclobacterium lianum]
MLLLKKLKISFIGLFMVLFIAGLSFSNLPVLEKVKTNLSVWKTNYAPEKVYLHHDRNFYRAGDVIWLKGYLVQASNRLPGNKSKIMYVALVDQQNQVVSKLMLDVAEGKANGDISIPEDLDEGRYFLRGYTNWMGNFDEQSVFSKEIYIWNWDSVAKRQQSENIATPDFQFFPEGGSLLGEIPSKVAFKATGPDGQGLKVSGEIRDSSGKKITDFQSRHQGMGTFEFIPSATEQYTATIDFPGGFSREVSLPEVATFGAHMSLLYGETQIKVNVFHREKDDGRLLLTGIAQDELHYSTTLDLPASGDTSLVIPTSEFPTGITRFTLAKASGEPLNERLVFVDHEDQIRLSLQANQEEHGRRELVELEITSKDPAGNPVAADLSLAVAEDQLAGNYTDQLDIASYLLLASEVKGHIASPGYYFNPENADRYEVLDLLLMTQGWRGFTWQQIVSDDFPEITISPEMAIKVDGYLRKDNGDPIANGDVVLFIKDKYETFISAETGAEGQFGFEGFYFRDSIDILIQGTDARGRTSDVNVSLADQSYQPSLPDTLPFYLSRKVAEFGREQLYPSQALFQGVAAEPGSLELGEVLLEEVVVEGSAEISRPMTLHRNADAVIEPSQLPPAPSGNILEVLQGRVAGLQVVPGGPNQFRAVIRGQGSPLYLLDGIPVDESMLQSINQFDISRIEILKSPANIGIYGGRGAGGVIALYTRRGPDEIDIEETGDHIKVFRIGGFSKSRQFYSPKYGENQVFDQPDRRSTIYWNPSVKTDENGKASVSFYTADRSSLYRVTAEGIADNGKLAHSTLGLEVY